MVDEQDGETAVDEISLVRGRRDYRRGIAAWFLMLLCVALTAVSSASSNVGSAELLRVVLWLPVGMGIGIWGSRCSTVARWTLGLAALVAFSLSLAEVVMTMRSGGEGVVVDVVLGIAIVVLSFHVLRTMVWNRDAKAYAIDREAGGIQVDER